MSKGYRIIDIIQGNLAIYRIHTIFVIFLLKHPKNNVLGKLIVHVANDTRKIYDKTEF